MSEPLWLDLDGLLKAHEEQIARFGGGSGIRHVADALWLSIGEARP